jgi:hypothetical protein
LSRHLAIDAGQTGIRTRSDDDEREFAGILTSEPLIPQLARLIRELGTFDVVSIGTTGLTADETDPSGLRELVGAGRVLMAHDSVTSYLGALGDRRGAVVAAGTGVVTLAVGASAVARVDGWGNLIGDAGSGYWIGRAALDAVMRAHELPESRRIGLVGGQPGCPDADHVEGPEPADQAGELRDERLGGQDAGELAFALVAAGADAGLTGVDCEVPAQAGTSCIPHGDP